MTIEGSAVPIATEIAPAPDFVDSVVPTVTPVVPLPPTEVEIPTCAIPYDPALPPYCSAPLRFADFPYACGISGVMAHGLSKKWAGHLSMNYGSSFDGLDRRGVNFLLEHSSRVGIDFTWDSYVEDLGGGWTDELHLGDVNVLFRIAESQRYLIRAGLGVNILGDAFGKDAGFNVTTKADLFPVRPVVLSGEMDLGTIGDAEMFHIAGKAGFAFDRFEVFGGYDYRTIGGVALQGPMVGLQIWF